MDSASSATFYERLPLPTIDRPFGIQLWPIFNKAFELVVGYPANDFRFQAGVTPMSTLKETGIFVLVYYIIILGGREVMRKKEPLQLKKLFLVHNFLLTAVSAILLALFVEQILPTVVRKGIFFAICDHDGGWTQPLVVLYYVGDARQTLALLFLIANATQQLNYLTKYLELLDTVFLFLKKKPLSTCPTRGPFDPFDQSTNADWPSSFPPLLPPWRHRCSLLHPTSR